MGPGGEPMRNRMDDERVAALHDGRLDAHERDELLSSVLADDEEYALFAETAAVLREIEEAHASAPPALAAPPANVASHVDAAPARAEHASDDVIPLATRRPPAPPITDAGAPVDSSDSAQSGDSRDGVISLDSRRRAPRRQWRVYGSIAAGLVGIGLAATLFTRARDTRLDDPMRAVAMLKAGAAPGPAAGWNEAFGPIFRGGKGNGEQPNPEPLAVKLGAYMVDLELAAASHDSALTRLGDRMAGLLDDVPLGDSAAKLYRKIARTAAANPRADVGPLLARGREAVRSAVIAPEWLELGIWAEAARTAAVRHDSGFFRDRRTRAVLERAATLPELDESTGAALGAIRAAIPADGRTLSTAKWSKLEGKVIALMRSAGRSSAQAPELDGRAGP